MRHIEEVPKTEKISSPEEERFRIEERLQSDRRHGREIAGLEPAMERFTPLQEGRDYEFMVVNPNVAADDSLQRFFTFVNPKGGEEGHLVSPPHWRSLTVPESHAKLITEETGGKPREEHYYVVNVKGAGYLKPTVRKDDLDRYDTWITEERMGDQVVGERVLGLATEKDFLNGDIVKKTQWFSEQGLRAEVYGAVARLKQVVWRGQLTPIEELQKIGVIPARRDFRPAMGVRLLKMNERVEEAARAEERRKKIFKEAFKTFNRETKDYGHSFPELSFGNQSHQQVYFREFCRRIGQNMAVLLNLGYSHYHLHSSNITMAAEFVDVGTMEHWKKDKDPRARRVYSGVRLHHIKDMRDVVYSLRILLKAGAAAGLETGKREDLVAAFRDGFDRFFDVEKVAAQKIDPQKAKECMEKIIDHVLIKREHLSSLQHHDIEEWSFKV